MASKNTTKIPLQLTPPNRQPGTYPARLLSLCTTDWVGDPDFHWSNEPDIFRLFNGHCYVVPGNEKTLVNGEELLVKRRLQDGDYIVCGYQRALFQADPVADYIENNDYGDEPLAICVSQRLLDNVRIDDTGISLDSGENFVEWGNLHHITIDIDRISSIRIDHFQNSEKVTGTQIEGLLKHEVTALVEWILYSCPFHPSIFLNDVLHLYVMDAYYYFAQRKIFIPALNSPEMPEPDFYDVMGLEFMRIRSRDKLFFLAGFIFLGIWLYQPHDLSIMSILGVVMASFVFAAKIAGIFFCMLLIQRVVTWIENRQNRCQYDIKHKSA